MTTNVTIICCSGKTRQWDSRGWYIAFLQLHRSNNKSFILTVAKPLPHSWAIDIHYGEEFNREDHPVPIFLHATELPE